MANLTQKLTYAQTWEVTFDGSKSVPVTSPVNPTTNTVEVSNSYTTEVTGEELTRTSVLCNAPGADDIVVCDVETASQCFAYLEANANNTADIEIAYVDESGNDTPIAVLAPGQSLYIPFLVDITPLSGNDCKLTGLAASGTQEVYVSASHNG